MKHIILTLTTVALVAACGMTGRMGSLRKGDPHIRISPAEDSSPTQLLNTGIARDTIAFEDDEGNKVTIMKAVREEDGEMVATDVISASVVTARFRNVAERRGKVDLKFDVAVPREMQDSRWQLRLRPSLTIMDETTELDPVIITGALYRKAQLKGYQQYEKYLASIISDTTVFITRKQLDYFIRRNMPEVYRFRNDSSIVTDNDFRSAFGVTGEEAVRHFTNKFRLRANSRRASRKDLMFAKLVKVPIVTEGLRLDTVMTSSDGDFLYRYTQTISTRPKLKKAMITLSGDIYEMDTRVYEIPRSDTVTFYISSLSFFTDNSEKYLTEVISRKVEAYTACYVEFRTGSSEIDGRLGNNASEIGRIKDNILTLYENDVFEMDSILVTASCSPEGSYAHNASLSRKRSESMSRYLSAYLGHVQDSLSGIVLDIEGVLKDSRPNVEFISRSNPENWTMLEALVRKDSTLRPDQKQLFAEIMTDKDPDAREAKLSKTAFYKYVRESIYPRLRTVRFDFHLHRKGMAEDTIITTVPDTAYMKGVEALRDRDYEKAVTILRPYADFNTAVAYCAMDYNASAMSILEDMERSDKVCYLLALLYARKGDVENAIKHYLQACALNPALINRGNLDPEISELTRKYDIDATALQ